MRPQTCQPQVFQNKQMDVNSPPNENSDDEYEEEEFLVYIDFDSKLLEDQLTDPNLNMKLIGVDTEHPIMQINSKIYKGTFEYAMGTNVFFNENHAGVAPDPNFKEMSERMYELYNKTDKVLKMKRIFVERNEEDAEGTSTEESTENLEPTKTYGQALNQFLKPGETPPRKIDDDYSVQLRRRLESNVLTSTSNDADEAMDDDGQGEAMDDTDMTETELLEINQLATEILDGAGLSQESKSDGKS